MLIAVASDHGGFALKETIKEYLRERSEKRTERRRAYYRHRAYKDKAEKRTLKTNRETLFKAISKEGKE